MTAGPIARALRFLKRTSVNGGGVAEALGVALAAGEVSLAGAADGVARACAGGGETIGASSLSSCARRLVFESANKPTIKRTDREADDVDI
jgi:hypothetical protein